MEQSLEKYSSTLSSWHLDNLPQDTLEMVSMIQLEMILLNLVDQGIKNLVAWVVWVERSQ